MVNLCKNFILVCDPVGEDQPFCFVLVTIVTESEKWREI